MSLENRYRSLVRCFPSDWRHRHGEALVSTLLDDSRPGQRWPSAGDTIDVVRNGLATRLRSSGPLGLIVIATGLLAAVTVAVDVAITPTPMAFLATSLLVVLAPGTGVVYSVSTAISRGWRHGSLAAIGCTLGIVPHLTAATLGLSGLMQASAEAFELIRWAGVAYLAYLGIGMLRSTGSLASTSTMETEARAGLVVRRGIFINLLNPKLTIFFFAFLPQFLASPPTLGDVRLIGLSVVFMAMTLAVFLCYSALAVQIRQRVLTTPRLLQWIERTFGVLLLGFAARLATTDR
jgi:threonine/homoserine/homoserine lactone efflux protein